MNKLKFYRIPTTILSALVLVFSCTQTIENDLTITNISVVDVVNGEIKPSMDVSINNGIISSIKNHQKHIQYKGEILDGTEKFVIPGLYDMHTHIFNNNDPQPPNTWYFPLMIANGVTSVRDMWVKTKEQIVQIFDWQKQLNEGTFIGPRIQGFGRLVDGDHPIQNSDTILSAKSAVNYVVQLKNEGVDFVKVYSHISKEVFDAFIIEAKNQKMHVSGHLPMSVDIEFASNSGMKSMEHIALLHLSFAKNEDSLRVKLFDNLIDKAILYECVKDFDEQKFNGIIATLIKNKTFITPTIWTSIIDEANLDLNFYENQEGIPFVPMQEYAEWQYFRDSKQLQNDSIALRDELLFKQEQFIIKKMFDAGVLLLAGTDAGYQYIIPGFSLIDEVIELKKAGLSNLGALQTATLNPAKYFDVLDNFGTVHEGKFADLVILESNPLENIENLKSIHGTILNGRLFDKYDLLEMKEKVLVSNYKDVLNNPLPLPSIELKDEILYKYQGNYHVKESNRNLNIELKDGLLTIDYGWMIDKLEPLSEHLFRVKGSNVHYNFFIDTSNSIQGFELLFEGKSIKYIKK